MSRGVQLIFALILALAVKAATDYVQQTRFEDIGAKPCAAGACVLTQDKRTGELFWRALPPAPDSDIIPKLGS